MNMTTYQDLASRTMKTNQSIRDVQINMAMGLAGEAGETCDLLKKYFFHGHELDVDKLRAEMGDVLWYVAGMATVFGFNLGDIAAENIEKLKKRYPKGFDKVRSQNRVEMTPILQNRDLGDEADTVEGELANCKDQADGAY